MSNSISADDTANDVAARSDDDDENLSQIIRNLDSASLTDERIERLVSAYPRTVTKRFLDAQADRPDMTNIIGRLREFAALLATQKRAWPWGAGPLERIFANVDRVYGMEAAKAQARSAIVTRSLSLPYAAAACSLTAQLSEISDIKIIKAVRLHEILLAAVERPGIEDEFNVRSHVWLDWLYRAGRVLQFCRDNRSYSLACEVEAQLMQMAEATGDRFLQADVDYRFAALLMQPCRSLTGATEGTVIKRWDERGDALEAASREPPLSPERVRVFPDADEALHRAEGRLRHALQEKLDPQRCDIGRIQLLLAEVLFKQIELQTPADPLRKRRSHDEAVDLARQAADALPVDDLPLRFQALAYLALSNQPVEPEKLGKLPPLDDLCAKYGKLETLRLILSEAQILTARDPDRAIATLAESRHLLRGFAHADRQAAMATYARAIFGGEVAQRAAELLEGVEGAVSGQQICAMARQRATKEGWGLTVHARVLAVVAGGPHILLQDALHLIDSAFAMMPLFAVLHHDPLAYTAASLAAELSNRAFRLLGSAEDGKPIFEARGDPLASIHFLGEALSRFTELGDVDPAIESVDVMAHMAEWAPKDATQGLISAIVDELQPRIVALEALAGERAFTAIARLLRLCVKRIITEGIDTGAWLGALHLAKGHALSTASISGCAYAIGKDPEAMALLRDIGTAQRDSGQDENDASRLDEVRLAVPYLSAQEERQDSAAVQGLPGLQHSFDDLVYSRLLNAPSRRTAAVDDILRSVPPGVVLLIFYILLDTDIKLVSTILTSESTTLVDQPLQDPAVLYRLDPALQPLNILGVKTLTLRDAIQRDPGSVCVASPAEEILRDWPNWALGPAKEILSDLHAKGYHRLFIVPDGPLHVFPFHLIGPIGQPLCGDWLVSYLPTPSILGSSTAGRSRPRRAGVDAFGIDFIGFPVEGWDELPEAISEAKSIAASAPGGRAVLNAQATRRAVADALEGAQWVHLGTHGTANAVAPAFNSLVLWPDSGDDGRLAIYDMLSLDLRGLELVTLSACNTALGRFDVADNVRSIPATLLLLGAKAVVSTLWPAETKSCATFFTSLYRVLGEGKSVDRAFLSAQEITRAAHPDYRDWGTFVLAG